MTALDAIVPRMISPSGPFFDVISDANKPGQIQLTRIFMLGRKRVHTTEQGTLAGAVVPPA